jgi:hypothetical protein
LAGDVDGLTWACDRDDVRIGGLPLLYGRSCPQAGSGRSSWP